MRVLNQTLGGDKPVLGESVFNNSRGTPCTEKRDLDDVTHEDVVYRLKTIYSDESRVSRVNEPTTADELYTPDLVVSINGVEDEVALEVKVSKGDFARAFWQCRNYHFQGYTPYIVAHKSILQRIEDRLSMINNYVWQNMPGIIEIDNNRLRVVREAEYQEIAG